MTINSIPQPSQPIAGGQRIDPTWYRWLRELDREARDTGADLSAEIEAIARKLGSPDGTIDGIPESSGAVSGLFPISVTDGRVSLATIPSEVGGELFGLTTDQWGRITALRPVVAGTGIEIDGTTAPEEIALVNLNPNVMTTLGDLIRGDTDGVPERLPIGANGQVLTVVSGAPAWAAGGGGGAVPVQDEGSTVVASPTAINFVGAGVTATASGTVATVTIPGGSGGVPDSIAELGSAWDALWVAIPGNSSGNVVGISAPTFVGVPGSMTPTSTNVFTSTPNIPHATATAATNAISSVRHTFDILNRRGGFRFCTTFGIDFGAETASHRLFVGLRALQSPATDVEPSTIVNGFGIGYDSADTQFQVIHNDASGTATKVALGSSFPKPTVSRTTMWRVDLWGSSDTSIISYRLKNIGTGDTASGTITTDMPAVTVSLNCNSWLSAGGTSTRAGIAWAKFAYGKPA